MPPSTTRATIRRWTDPAGPRAGVADADANGAAAKGGRIGTGGPGTPVPDMANLSKPDSPTLHNGGTVAPLCESPTIQSAKHGVTQRSELPP